MAGSRNRNKGGNGNGGQNKNNNQNQKTCNNCGKTGHIATACRSPKKNNGNGNNQNNQKNNNTQKCQYCNKTNHKSDACHFKPGAKNNTNTNANTKGGNVTRACTKCQGWHLDRDCNAPSNSLGPDGKPLKCKFCSLPHFNNACPTKFGQPIPTNNTNTSNNTDPVNPYFNTTTNGVINQNEWNSQSHLSRPCLYCNSNHFDEECTMAEHLRPGIDPRYPPLPQYVRGPDGAFQLPPFPPPTASFFPYQGITTPLPSAPKYQDDADETHIPTNIYGTAGISAFAAHTLGRNGNEFHRDVWSDRDGDIEMEDVDGCGECEFGVQEVLEMRREREIRREIMNLRYQAEMQELARRGDERGFGVGWKYP